MRDLVVIAHDIRSTHNVGSLLRTAEGLGVQKVWFTGYTPYPCTVPDARLPHVATKLDRQIHKTALGAEDLVAWEYMANVVDCIAHLKQTGFTIAALEQAPGSTPLPSFTPPHKLALVLGREVEGVAADLLAQCDVALEIPMFGTKESFNVIQAAAMALYQCRFPGHI